MNDVPVNFFCINRKKKSWLLGILQISGEKCKGHIAEIKKFKKNWVFGQNSPYIISNFPKNLYFSIFSFF